MGMNRKKVRIMVGTFWVNKHRDAPCDGEEPNNFCDDIAKGFGKAMKKQGHSWIVRHDDTKASPEDWLEPDDNKSRSGADSVHFAILAAHGRFNFRDRSDPNPDEFSFLTAFGRKSTKLGICHWNNLKIRTSRGIGKTRLGNNKLKWLVVDACESVQLHRPNHRVDRFRHGSPAKQWRHTFHGLNLIFGFTESVSDASWTRDRGTDFGTRAGSGDRLGHAWTEEAYSWWMDDYPVAMAGGRTKKQADNRVENERIDSRFKRIPNRDLREWVWLWRE